MAEWDLKSNYDYRFGALMLQASCGDERSPIYHLRLSDILRHVAPHELRHYLQDATQPYEPEMDLDEMRRAAIQNTDVRGKTCLDLSGYDGWAAKMMHEKGASRTAVVDSEQWRVYGWKEPEPIDGVEFIKSDMYAWHERFDVVVWYNCLYHVPDPMRALAHVRTLTKETMLLCALHRFNDGPWLYCYLPYECNPDDPSVYFGPSISALERMLTLTGWTFRQEGIAADRVVYRCTPIPDFVDAETEAVRRASNNIRLGREGINDDGGSI